MASKFQNRLVGAIVLVALGVIVIPSLLDGQKKHYQDEFAAIPLVPKPGDNDEPDMLPAATQALPSQPPAGAGEEVRASASVPAIDAASLPGDGGAGLDALPPGNRVNASAKPKPRAQTLESRIAGDAGKMKPAPTVKPEPSAKPTKESAPVGKAWVIQLGALKNADKVNEVVSKLRAAGYRTYTSPATPVQRKITRILVGPDTSKDKLKGQLDDLKQVSGLNGVVMGYSVN